MKQSNPTAKIDELKNKPENRKCFDCREKVGAHSIIARAFTSSSSFAQFINGFCL